MQLDTTVRL